MIDRLKEDPRVKAAGIIGRYFRTNPLELLDTSPTGWAIVTAAYEHASEIEAKASKKTTSSVPNVPRMPRH